MKHHLGRTQGCQLSPAARHSGLCVAAVMGRIPPPGGWSCARGLPVPAHRDMVRVGRSAMTGALSIVCLLHGPDAPHGPARQLVAWLSGAPPHWSG